MSLLVVVSELSEIVTTSVESQNVPPGGVGHTVSVLVHVLCTCVCVCVCACPCARIAIIHVTYGTQVVILFISGLTLSLTSQCTFGDKRYVTEMCMCPSKQTLFHVFIQLHLQHVHKLSRGMYFLASMIYL